jgi:hypothetical protein
VALFLSRRFEEEVEDLARFAGDARPEVATWLVFKTDGSAAEEEMMEAARHGLLSLTPGAAIGGGSGDPKGFVGLNRDRPSSLPDVATYRIVAQAHAFDDLSVMETLEAQGETVRTARAFLGDVALSVGPISLLGSPPGLRSPEEMPPEADPRLRSLFGAAWTAGSVKYLAEAGATALTYFEATGSLGIMTEERVFPAYHVLADIQEFSGGMVRPTASSHPLQVVAMSLERQGRHRLFVSNLTDNELSANVQLPAAEMRLRRLDLDTVERAMADPEGFRSAPGDPVKDGNLTLGPLATLRLDG